MNLKDIEVTEVLGNDYKGLGWGAANKGKRGHL